MPNKYFIYYKQNLTTKKIEEIPAVITGIDKEELLTFLNNQNMRQNYFKYWTKFEQREE